MMFFFLKGKLFYEVVWDIEGCVDVIDYYVGFVFIIIGKYIQFLNGFFFYIRREFFGVVVGWWEMQNNLFS